jgi:glycosyltransferase involved in cell wall biosynthesis
LELPPGAYKVKIRQVLSDNDDFRFWSETRIFFLDHKYRLHQPEDILIRRYEVDKDLTPPISVNIKEGGNEFTASGTLKLLPLVVSCSGPTGIHQMALYDERQRRWQYFPTFFQEHHGLSLPPGEYKLRARKICDIDFSRAGPWSVFLRFKIDRKLRLSSDNNQAIEKAERSEDPTDQSAGASMNPSKIPPSKVKDLMWKRWKYLQTLDSTQLLRKVLTPYLNISNSFDFAKKCMNVLGDRDFDYVQAHDTHALIAADKVSKKTGSKVIYDALEIPEDRSGIAAKNIPFWLRIYERRLERRLIRASDKVISIGPAVAEFTANRYRVGVPTVIRNCCLYTPIEKSNAIRMDLALQDRDKICVVLGSIYNNQGLEQCIECISYLSANIHIAALGRESEIGFVDYLMRLASEANVTSRFHILPPQPPHLLINYLSGADLGIISRQGSCLNNLYSLPNKIFEMIMARLPVICGRLPNIQMILEEYGIGESFDETDPANMAQVINSIFDDDASYARYKEAVNKASEELCWENESRRYVQYVEE